MIELPITDREIKLADMITDMQVEYCHDFGSKTLAQFSKESIRQNHEGQGLLGLVGEIKLAKYLNVPLHIVIGGVDDYDFLINDKKIDIKTQHWKQGNPTPEWGVNVPIRMIRKKVDYYVFVLINLDERRMILGGFMTHNHFFKQADHYNTGERVTPSFVVSQEMYSIKIKKLNPIESFRRILRLGPLTYFK